MFNSVATIDKCLTYMLNSVATIDKCMPRISNSDMNNSQISTLYVKLGINHYQIFTL